MISVKNLPQNIKKDTVTNCVKDIYMSICAFFKFILARVHEFSTFDFALMKLCLISFGLCLGSKFTNFFKKFRFVLLIGFILSFIYLIWRVFIRED